MRSPRRRGDTRPTQLVGRSIRERPGTTGLLSVLSSYLLRLPGQDGDTAQRPAFRVFRFRAAAESATCPLTGSALRNQAALLLLSSYFLRSPEESTKEGRRRRLVRPLGRCARRGGLRGSPFGRPLRPHGSPPAPLPSASREAETHGSARQLRLHDTATARTTAWQEGDMFRFRVGTESATCPLTGSALRNPGIRPRCLRVSVVKCWPLPSQRSRLPDPHRARRAGRAGSKARSRPPKAQRSSGSRPSTGTSRPP